MNKSVIPFHERLGVVRACKYVDVAIPQLDMNKAAAKKSRASLLFVGDGWYSTPKWNEFEFEIEIAAINCDVIYFPYTAGASNTLINDTLAGMRQR